MTGRCYLCVEPCDGSLMRTDPRYSRVRTMLSDAAIPRFSEGGIALCHRCQRSVYFAGGFLRLMSMALEKGDAHWSGRAIRMSVSA